MAPWPVPSPAAPLVQFTFVLKHLSIHFCATAYMETAQQSWQHIHTTRAPCPMPPSRPIKLHRSECSKPKADKALQAFANADLTGADRQTQIAVYVLCNIKCCDVVTNVHVV